MSNKESKPTEETILIKPVTKDRYINIKESIYMALKPASLSVYLALRFEADYSRDCSDVKKNRQFLANRAKVSVKQIQRSLNDLEICGLVARQLNPGYQSTYWVADELNYFTPKSLNAKNDPGHTDPTPGHTDPTPGSHRPDILTNVSINNFNPIENAREDDQNLNTDDKKATCSETPNDLQSSAPSEADEKMLDPNYEYPETLFQQSHPVTSTLIDTSTSSDAFDKFFEIYPRKIGRQRAWAQWEHDKCDNIADTILGRLQDQISRDKSFIDGYAPNPCKYIAEKRYLDEVYEVKKQKPKSEFDFDDTSWRNL